MKAVLLVIGVLGLATLFGMIESAPASTQRVTSNEVRLVSESDQTPSQAGRQAGQYGGFRGRQRIR